MGGLGCVKEDVILHSAGQKSPLRTSRLAVHNTVFDLMSEVKEDKLA